MKRYFNLLLLAGAFVAFQIGCGEDDGNNNTPPEDGGNGNDTSTDTGTEPPPNNLILSDEAGVIQPNIWGINGVWGPYDDGAGSTATGTPTATGGMCITGHAAQVIGEEYSTYWGAGSGFSLCYDDTGTEKTIGTCPTVMTNIIGFRATITANTFPAGELRVLMAEKYMDLSGNALVTDENVTKLILDENGNPTVDTTGAAPKDRKENTYVLVDEAATTAGTPQEFLFSASKVQYAGNPDDPALALDPNRVRALQFQVSTLTTAEYDFDFCLENLEAITQ
jgi:hypothetical protein